MFSFVPSLVIASFRIACLKFCLDEKYLSVVENGQRGYGFAILRGDGNVSVAKLNESVCDYFAKQGAISFRKHGASVYLRVSAGELLDDDGKKEILKALSVTLDSSGRQDSSWHLS